MSTLIYQRDSLRGTDYTVQLPSGQVATVDLPNGCTWRDIEELVVFLRSLAPTIAAEDTDGR